MICQVQRAMLWSLPLLLVLGMTPHPVSASGNKTVCYYPSWSYYRKNASYTVKDVPVELCSHVIYAFAHLDNVTLKIVESDPDLDKKSDNYGRFIKLRQRNPKAKMLLGLGGWTDSKKSDKYSRLVATSESMTSFISHVIPFLKGYGFDGLDLDWEFPASDDKQGFSLWVEKLKTAFEPHDLLLTAAVSGGKDVIDQGYNVPAVAKALDQIHIMAYDFHGDWNTNVSHHAPLYPVPGQSEELSADFAVRYWIEKGAEPSKLVLGVPFYGRSWTLIGTDASPGAAASGSGNPGPLLNEPGTLTYSEICLAEKEGWNKFTGPYLTKGDQWVGYDDVDAIKTKTQYAKSKELGGIMVWEISMDDFQDLCKGGSNPLLNTIASTFGSLSPPSPATVQFDLQKCKTVSFAPDPHNCSKYYRCSGDQITHKHCPASLHWNQDKLVCDWPANSPCSVNH